MAEAEEPSVAWSRVPHGPGHPRLFPTTDPVCLDHCPIRYFHVQLPLTLQVSAPKSSLIS